MMISIVEKLQNLVIQNMAGKVPPEEFQKQMQEVSKDLAKVFEAKNNEFDGNTEDDFDIESILDGVDQEGLLDDILSKEEKFEDDDECESCKI